MVAQLRERIGESVARHRIAFAQIADHARFDDILDDALRGPGVSRREVRLVIISLRGEPRVFRREVEGGVILLERFIAAPPALASSPARIWSVPPADPPAMASPLVSLRQKSA